MSSTLTSCRVEGQFKQWKYKHSNDLYTSIGHPNPIPLSKPCGVGPRVKVTNVRESRKKKRNCSPYAGSAKPVRREEGRRKTGWSACGLSIVSGQVACRRTTHSTIAYLQEKCLSSQSPAISLRPNQTAGSHVARADSEAIVVTSNRTNGYSSPLPSYVSP